MKYSIIQMKSMCGYNKKLHILYTEDGIKYIIADFDVILKHTESSLIESLSKELSDIYITHMIRQLGLPFAYLVIDDSLLKDPTTIISYESTSLDDIKQFITITKV